jgi:hypothetical protein
MQSKKIYFLHIPKTSGMKMQYELLESSVDPKSINSPSVYIPGEFEFVFNPAIADGHNIICGHFGRNPINSLSDIFTFSMIREPLEQYLSLARYAAKQAEVDFDEEFLDAFINNDNDAHSRFEGMSGCDNPQSCFLYSQISNIEGPNGLDENGRLRFEERKTVFLEKPKTYEDVKERTENMLLGTMENRLILVRALNKILKTYFNIELNINQTVLNSTPKMSFMISKRHRALIENKTWIDVELYKKISESEKRI